ncbi:MAG: hypothetical protein KKA55_05925 [Proteobacteria bacterium]|nr:hypothetical protein [Pseudomonadota bacterium]MBU1595057.1 hypothetical protein [Pseudomonadota bacterium]
MEDFTMEGDCVRFSRIISAVDLKQRWSGLMEYEFSFRICNGVIQPYLLLETQISSDNKTVFVCTSKVDWPDMKLSNWPVSKWNDVVFKMDDVEHVEEQDENRFFLNRPIHSEDHERSEVQCDNTDKISNTPVHAEYGERLREANKASVGKVGNQDVTTPQGLIEQLRAEGVTDMKVLAAKVVEQFPKLSDSALGKLLPASPDATVSWPAQNSRGRRLRGKKK